MKQQTLARLKLLAVFLLFAAPLTAAYVLYYGMPGQISGAATNKGMLVDPAVPLPVVTLAGQGSDIASGEVLRGQWTFLQVASDGCGGACRQSLLETRQIWALLHDERDRVQRVLIVGGAGPAPAFQQQPRLQVYSGEVLPLRNLFEAESADAPGTVYLIDPLGNWVLYYPPEQNGEALFDDTKHLLKLSHIG